jgi:hypothetical protein
MRLWGRRDLRQICRQREAGCRTRLHTDMDVRRSRLPENPVNIGLSAQKSAKQGDGPSARGTQSTKEGSSYRGSAPAPCKERFLLTILSSRRIRLHPANGSHYSARKTIRPGAIFYSIHFLHRSGARFCSKCRRITLLSGAVRMPIKRKSEQPHFKSGGVRETK